MHCQIKKAQTLFQISSVAVLAQLQQITEQLAEQEVTMKFISKISIVEEEADESTFWLDIIPETNNSNRNIVESLLTEARELTAIFTAASKTAKSNKDIGKSTIGKQEID